MLSKKFLDNPANYLYIFASEEFLKQLDKRSQGILRAKAYYQNQLIINAIGGNQNYEVAREELHQAIMDIYGMTPAQMLVDLAMGKTVGGKNWSEGIYGIGAIKKVNTFEGTGSNLVTVNPETGAISMNGVVVSTDSQAMIGTNKKHNNVIGYTYTDSTGTTYTSQYNKVTGKYYCGTQTGADGVVKLADGTVGSQADMNTVWAGVVSDAVDFLKNVLNKYLDQIELAPGETILTEKKALPAQEDGFVVTEEKAGAGWMLPVVAAGAAVALYAANKKK